MIHRMEDMEVYHEKLRKEKQECLQKEAIFHAVLPTKIKEVKIEDRRTRQFYPNDYYCSLCFMKSNRIIDCHHKYYGFFKNLLSLNHSNYHNLYLCERCLLIIRSYLKDKEYCEDCKLWHSKNDDFCVVNLRKKTKKSQEWIKGIPNIYQEYLICKLGRDYEEYLRCTWWMNDPFFSPEINKYMISQYYEFKKMREEYIRKYPSIYKMKKACQIRGLSWWEIPNEYAETYHVLLELKRQIREVNKQL